MAQAKKNAVSKPAAKKPAPAKTTTGMEKAARLAAEAKKQGRRLVAAGDDRPAAYFEKTPKGIKRIPRE